MGRYFSGALIKRLHAEDKLGASKLTATCSGLLNVKQYSRTVADSIRESRVLSETRVGAE